MRFKRGMRDITKNAQTSMEFLLIFALTSLITIPLILLYLRESQGASNEVNLAQVGQISRKIVSVAEFVYAFGDPTSVTLKVYMPSPIKSISINDTEISFVVDNQGNLVTISNTFSMNVTGSLNATPGIHNILIAASGNSVVISDVSK